MRTFGFYPSNDANPYLVIIITPIIANNNIKPIINIVIEYCVYNNSPIIFNSEYDDKSFQLIFNTLYISTDSPIKYYLMILYH